MLQIKVDTSAAGIFITKLKTKEIGLANRRALKRAADKVSKEISIEVRSQKLVKANSADLKDRIKLFANVGSGPLGGDQTIIVNAKAFRAQRFFPRRTRVRIKGRVYRGVKIRVLGKTIDTGGFTLEVGPKSNEPGKSRPRRTKRGKPVSKYRRTEKGTVGPKEFVVKRKHRAPGTKASERTPLKSVWGMSLADIVRYSNVERRACAAGRLAYQKTFEHEMKWRMAKLASKGKL